MEIPSPEQGNELDKGVVETMLAEEPELQLPVSEPDVMSETSESDIPRGRSRARDPIKQAPQTTNNQGGTGESETFRGRTRWRSTSGSQYTTPARGASPARRVLLRMAMKNRNRSQSPSRSRSRDSAEWRRSIRRRERSTSRNRDIEYGMRSGSGLERGGKEDALGPLETGGFDERQPSVGVTQGIQMG